MDATRSSHGTDGGRGGNGGVGGDGGHGAAAGKGGHVTVRVNAEDTDTLMYINVPNVSGGKGGRGGNGGFGGHGGFGGSGGSSYTYTTTHRTMVMAGRTMVPMTHTQSHMNYGGMQGFSGTAGNAGNRGHDGKGGKDGFFEIIVSGTEKVRTYCDPYQLQITEVVLKDQSDDDIIEPGETVQCFLTVKNVGGMPTPPNHAVTFSVKSKEWVQYNPRDSNVLVLEKGIEPGEAFSFSKPLLFSVAYQMNVPLNHSLDISTRMAFQAVMGRVNIPFQSIENQFTNMKVRYPVQITTHMGVQAITIQEAAPFAFAIKNISSKPLRLREFRGIHTIIQGVTGRFFNEGDFLYYDNTGELCHSERCIFKAIKKLKPGQVKVISGLIQFSPSCLDRLNKSADIRSTLSLQLLGTQSGKGPIPIEHHISSLQLTEGYIPPSENYKPDVLLVTDATVTSEVIEKWRAMLGEIGLVDVSIWNMTSYGGLNLHKTLQHGRSLKQDFSAKTIVIFNTDASRSLWSMSDLFLAARDCDINTYIVGTHEVSFVPSLIPVDGDTPRVHRSSRRLIKSLIEEEDGRPPKEYDTVEITKKYRFGRQPRLEDLIKKAKQVNDTLSDAIPDRCFVVGYDYQVQEVEERFSLGTIVVHSSLKKSEASIGYLRALIEEVDTRKNQHQYGLLKLLNFDQKLELISKLYEGPCRYVLGQAILSDIADEQKTYREEKWMGRISTSDINEGLEKVQMLGQYEAKNGEEEYVIDLLLKAKQLAKGLCSTKDKLLPGRRGKIVRDRTITLVNRALACFARTLGDGLINDRNIAIKEDLRDFQTPEDLIQFFCDPLEILKSGMFIQDNTQRITEEVMPLTHLNEVRDRYRVIEIAEGRFIFDSKEQRRMALEQVEAQILNM